MNAVNAMCTPDSLVRLQKAVQKPTCPNEILSCTSPTGPITCVDATTGGGATSAELAECATWSAQGGGWSASGEPCGGVAAITGVASLVQNGGFETPSLATADCQGKTDPPSPAEPVCIPGTFLLLLLCVGPALVFQSFGHSKYFGSNRLLNCEGGYDSSFRGDDHCKYRLRGTSE